MQKKNFFKKNWVSKIHQKKNFFKKSQNLSFFEKVWFFLKFIWKKLKKIEKISKNRGKWKFIKFQKIKKIPFSSITPNSKGLYLRAQMELCDRLSQYRDGERPDISGDLYEKLTILIFQRRGELSVEFSVTAPNLDFWRFSLSKIKIWRGRTPARYQSYSHGSSRPRYHHRGSHVAYL